MLLLLIHGFRDIAISDDIYDAKESRNQSCLI